MTTAYFIGTSITDGWNGVTSTQAYPTAMSARMGWTPTIDGIGGSGYTVAPTFASRLSAVVAAAPDVVVVEGGADDGPSEAVWTACDAFLVALRAALPNAKIYVTASNQAYSASETAFAASTRKVGGVYVSWVPWFTGTGDTTHPAGNGNRDVYVQSWPHCVTAGYQYIGTRFAFAIRPPSTGLDY